MKVKEVSKYYYIKKFSFRESLRKTNSLFKDYGKFIVPVFFIYQLINIITNKMIVFPEGNPGYFMSLVLIVLISILLSIISLLYRAYVFYVIEDQIKMYFSKICLLKAAKKIGSMIITLLAVFIKSFPVIIVSVIPVILLSIFLPMGNYDGRTIYIFIMIILVLIMVPAVFYLILKYSLSLINTLKFDIKGFSAANLSSFIFKINKKQLFIYGIFFIFIPLTLSAIINLGMQNSFLKLLVSIVSSLIVTYTTAFLYIVVDENVKKI